jgi:hypothetical protein
MTQVVAQPLLSKEDLRELHLEALMEHREEDLSWLDDASEDDE